MTNVQCDKQEQQIEELIGVIEDLLKWKDCENDHLPCEFGGPKPKDWWCSYCKSIEVLERIKEARK
jgi:hypothetical protein